MGKAVEDYRIPKPVGLINVVFKGICLTGYDEDQRWFDCVNGQARIESCEVTGIVEGRVNKPGIVYLLMADTACEKSGVICGGRGPEPVVFQACPSL